MEQAYKYNELRQHEISGSSGSSALSALCSDVWVFLFGLLRLLFLICLNTLNPHIIQQNTLDRPDLTQNEVLLCIIIVYMIMHFQHISVISSSFLSLNCQIQVKY